MIVEVRIVAHEMCLGRNKAWSDLTLFCTCGWEHRDNYGRLLLFPQTPAGQLEAKRAFEILHASFPADPWPGP